MVGKEQNNATIGSTHFKMNKHSLLIKIIGKHIFTIIAVILLILKSSMILILIFNHF
jgi:hypothetical protein